MARRLVHNELLCLIYNNIQSVDDPSFVNAVIQFFKNSDVMDARKQICKDMRNANCRICSENEFFKTKADKMGDIIRMVKHIYDVNLQHAMPRYCAFDLSKMPFLKYGHLPKGKVSSVGKLNQRVEKIENIITNLTTKVSGQVAVQDNGTQASLHDVSARRSSKRRKHKPHHAHSPGRKIFQYPYNEFGDRPHRKEKWVYENNSGSQTSEHQESKKSDWKFKNPLEDDEEVVLQDFEDSQEDTHLSDCAQAVLALNKA